MKELDATITINRITSNRDDDCISIAVRDEKSFCDAIRIRMTPHDLGMALTGLAYLPCKMVFNDSGVIGKRREGKDEIVTVPKHDYADRKRVAATAVADFEVDGWEGSVADAMNQHRVVSHNKDGSTDYRVGFVRFVDDVEPEATR